MGENAIQSQDLVILNSTKDKIEVIFSRSDLNGDGKITAGDIKECLSTSNMFSPAEIDKIVNDLEKYSHGFVNVEEFLDSLSDWNNSPEKGGMEVEMERDNDKISVMEFYCGAGRKTPDDSDADCCSCTIL